MTKILWTLPFPSSGGGNTRLLLLPGRDLALIVEAVDESDLQIVFEQAEAYKCTFLFALSKEMQIAYDKLVNLGETSWLTAVKNRVRDYGEYISTSPTHGPPDQLLHLMITFDDGPCYEVLCQKFRVEQTPVDPVH